MTEIAGRSTLAPMAGDGGPADAELAPLAGWPVATSPAPCLWSRPRCRVSVNDTTSRGSTGRPSGLAGMTTFSFRPDNGTVWISGAEKDVRPPCAIKASAGEALSGSPCADRMTIRSETVPFWPLSDDAIPSLLSSRPPSCGRGTTPSCAEPFITCGTGCASVRETAVLLRKTSTVSAGSVAS